MFDLFSFFPIGTMIPVYQTVLLESLDPVSISDLTSDKSALSLSLCNPSLALFDRGNPFQQLCPLSYLLGNPCQTDQIVTTAMRRCLASRLATENSERHTLSSLSWVNFSIAEAEQ